jgi:hypothetical protein
MRRSLGLAWFAAAVVTLAAVALAATAALVDGMAGLALGAAALGAGAGLLGLLATPLALAPAEALRASLAARQPGVAAWGEDRKDLWGALAREIAQAAAPPQAQDHGLDIRRLAANLELTLRQTGEELAAVSARVEDAAGRLDSAAAAGARLTGVAEEATRQLAAAVQRTDDATGALAVLPNLAAEQAGTIEKAALRTLAAADAMAAAASRPPPLPEPASEADAETLALREAAQRGAEQARRLEQAMPLLIEAIRRIPAAAASQEALAATASRLAEDTERLGKEIARLEALPELLGNAAAATPPDPATLLAPLLDALGPALAPAVAAQREAADAVAVRVADIAEVMALQAGWRVAEVAEKAVARLESAVEAVTATGAAVAGEALAGLAAPLDAHRATLDALSAKLDAIASRLEAVSTDTTLREVAADIVDRAEALLVRLEALGVAPAAQKVSGEGRLDAVADRLVADLADGAAEELPVTLLSLEETIRRLQEQPEDPPSTP